MHSLLLRASSPTLRYICHPPSDTGHTNGVRKSGAQTQKQAATWLTPEQIERIRDACLTDIFSNYLQGRNETIVTLLADTGLRVSELVALDWDHIDLTADPPELFFPGGLQKGTKRAAYLDLEPETARQLRRYRNEAWKTTEAVFPSRQSVG